MMMREINWNEIKWKTENVQLATDENDQERWLSQTQSILVIRFWQSHSVAKM